MSEAIYRHVEDAIKRKLHLGRGWEGMGNKWCYPVAIEDGLIVVRDSDCGLAKPTWTYTPDRWDAMVKEHGLWRKTGFWHFTQADDPDCDLIEAAHRNPSWAGREIARLRKLLEERGD
jgi:hypothetical protein